MTKEQCNIFLIQKFEHYLSEINCSGEYLMELFISDIMQEEYVIEKVTYRQRKNILLTYRGLLFLDVGVKNLSEVIVVCLIRAGMVFVITEIWKAFIEKRDFCGNITTAMEEAKQKNPAKTKATKFKIIKAVVAKTKKRNTEKSSKAIFKPASRKSKKSTILLKSETKNKSSGDDYQSKFILSTQLKCKNPAEDFSFKKIDTMSDAIHDLDNPQRSNTCYRRY